MYLVEHSIHFTRVSAIVYILTDPALSGDEAHRLLTIQDAPRSL